MAEKPSLYVVEKKEVVILVVIFILVTVLAFTLGVKYGESVGRRVAITTQEAEKAHADAAADKVGGTLGAEVLDSPKSEHPENEDKQTSAPTTDSHSPEAQAGGHKTEERIAPNEESKLTNETIAAVETNSDKYLLEALKEAGVETPVEKKKTNELPQAVKAPPKGDYVIQVGSYPTKRDAERQVDALKHKKLMAMILPPFKDRQGEWYRVVLGSYKNRNSAEKAAQLLKAKGDIRSYFVKKRD